MSELEVATMANITCPNCGFTRQEEMPADSCQFFYECSQCGTVLRPEEGDCCVFCSYADMRCPPMQMKGESNV
jgi:rubredoxin